jgi:hypothetical protein
LKTTWQDYVSYAAVKETFLSSPTGDQFMIQLENVLTFWSLFLTGNYPLAPFNKKESLIVDVRAKKQDTHVENERTNI